MHSMVKCNDAMNSRSAVACGCSGCHSDERSELTRCRRNCRIITMTISTRHPPLSNSSSLGCGQAAKACISAEKDLLSPTLRNLSV